MRAVIIGCGAIGAHIAYSLYEYGYEILIITKEDTYKKIIKAGLNIQVNENKKILIKKNIKINIRFKVYKSIKNISGIKIDYLFITVKLKDYNKTLIKSISGIVDNNTAIIPPCTNIPFWWINNFFSRKIKKERLNYFNIKNIIGMTMWLSSVKKSSNFVMVRHIQRGYPLKAISKKMEDKANKLRAAFKSTSKSPKVNDIYSELYIKSLNALAFNMTALYFKQNNQALKNNKKAINMIKKIMIEGEEVMNFLKITHSQNYNQRINQTLSSSIHTMSMLNDFKKGKKIELKYLWDSYKFLLKLSRIKMNYTNQIYKEVIKKINS